jgi:hypothetical protein
LASLNQNVREGVAKFFKNATVRNTLMTVEAQGLDHLKLDNAPVISSPDRVIAYHPYEQLRSRRVSISVFSVSNNDGADLGLRAGDKWKNSISHHAG